MRRLESTISKILKLAFIVTEKDGVLLVDSRLIASRIGIEHESFMRTVAKYQSQTEQAFVGLRLEIGVPDQPSGNPPRNL